MSTILQNSPILMAKSVKNPAQDSLGILDMTVTRNAYGRQLASDIFFGESKLSDAPLEMVFIRAPRIIQTGSAVEVLARRDDFATLVRQGNVLAATFHPELSSDRRVHKEFVETITASTRK